MIEQLLEDDIAAAQMLSMSAMHYAGATITAAVGETPPGSNVQEALKALIRAREITSASTPLPPPVISALRNLQVVAVLFTVQLTVADSGTASESLQLLGDKLIATLEQGTARLHAHDNAATAQALCNRALDYTHQIVSAEDNHTPIGSAAVEQAIIDLQIAAVTFTAQLVIAEGHDTTPLRRLEERLVSRLSQL
jgi:hypothetical protein